MLTRPKIQQRVQGYALGEVLLAFGILSLAFAGLIYGYVQANRLSDTAALFQALGGGWWNRDDGTGNPARRMTCKPPKAPGVVPAATGNAITRTP